MHRPAEETRYGLLIKWAAIGLMVVAGLAAFAGIFMGAALYGLPVLLAGFVLLAFLLARARFGRPGAEGRKTRTVYRDPDYRPEQDTTHRVERQEEQEARR